MAEKFKRIEAGMRFSCTCIFSGVSHNYEIVSRDGDIIRCNPVYQEPDGIHKVTEDFEVFTEDDGREYIVYAEYLDEKFSRYVEDCWKPVERERREQRESK